jgi:magnesium transporter
MARTRVYRNGELAAEGFPVAEISDHLADEASVVWCDLTDPNKDDLLTIRDELSLHSLAIEDALQARQRPKVDRYEGHLFATVYGVDVDRRTGSLAAHEVGVFVTPRAIITAT